MRLTPIEAEALVGRMFPGSRAGIADGDDRQESGVVQDAKGVTIASFRLLYGASSRGNEMPEVNEIRVGDVGQFCGTVKEIRDYEQRQVAARSSSGITDASEAESSDDASSPTTILVPLELGRIEQIPGENLAQVWGHVDDYEVAIPMRLDDPRITRFV